MGKTDENKVLSNGEFKKQQKERKNKLKKSLRKKVFLTEPFGYVSFYVGK
jgi:hypothetical protein